MSYIVVVRDSSNKKLHSWGETKNGFTVLENEAKNGFNSKENAFSAALTLYNCYKNIGHDGIKLKLKQI